MAEVNILIKATDQASGVLKNTGMRFTELKAKFDLASIAAREVFQALQKVYELGKQGAALDYAAGKFDRLAQSIGQTSEVLLRDLRKATSGMMSDAELMAQAGDIMGLGLAKTSDQLIRLTTVSGGLGMDMNQLVLALTNQTTARFDQLNVSVDGFDERLKKLKDTGMDANEAFTEAFLQQAEIQLDKIGSKADTDAGSIARMEASWKNFGDTLKLAVAPAVADVADELAEFLTVQNMVNERMEKFNRNQGSGAQRTSARRREVWLAQLESSSGWQATANRYAAAVEEYAKAEEEAAAAADENYRAQLRSADSTNYWEQQAQGARNEAIRLANETKNAAAAMDIYNQGLSDMQTATDNLNLAQIKFNESFGDKVVSKLEAAGIKGEDLEIAIGGVDSVMGTNLLTQYKLEEELDNLIANFDPKNPDEFTEALGRQKTEWEKLDEGLQAAKKGFEDARGAFQRLLEDLSNANGMEFEIKVHTFKYGGGTSGTGGTTVGMGGKTTVGGEPIQQSWATGVQNFTVPPHFPNDSYIVGLTSGERVSVTPAGQASTSGPGGGVTITGNVTVYANNPREFIRELEREAAQQRRSGAAYAMGR